MSQSFKIPSDPLRRICWDGYEKSQKEVVHEAASGWLSTVMGISILKMIVSFFVHHLLWSSWVGLGAIWYVGVVIGDIGVTHMTKCPITIFHVYCGLSIVFGLGMGAFCVHIHWTEYLQALECAKCQPHQAYGSISQGGRGGIGGVPEVTCAPGVCHSNTTDWFHTDIASITGKLWYFLSVTISTSYCLGVETIVHAKAIYWTWRLTREWDAEAEAMDFKDADLYDDC